MGYIYHPFDACVTKLSLDFDSEIAIHLFPRHKLCSHESCLTRRNLHPTRVVPASGTSFLPSHRLSQRGKEKQFIVTEMREKSVFILRTRNNDSAPTTARLSSTTYALTRTDRVHAKSKRRTTLSAPRRFPNGSMLGEWHGSNIS